MADPNYGKITDERVADADVPVHQRLQIPRLLRLRAVLDQGQHGGVLRPHAVERPSAQVGERAADLDLDQGACEVSKPHPAPFNRHERTPQALVAGLRLHLPDDLEERSLADLVLRRQHDLVDEAGHARTKRLQLGWNLEVDHGRPPFLPPSRESLPPSDQSGVRPVVHA